MFIKNNYEKTNLNVKLPLQQNSSKGREIYIGYSNNQQANYYLNQSYLSFSKNRSINKLPGYIPLLGFEIKLK